MIIKELNRINIIAPLVAIIAILIASSGFANDIESFSNRGEYEKWHKTGDECADLNNDYYKMRRQRRSAMDEYDRIESEVRRNKLEDVQEYIDELLREVTNLQGEMELKKTTIEELDECEFENRFPDSAHCPHCNK